MNRTNRILVATATIMSAAALLFTFHLKTKCEITDDKLEELLLNNCGDLPPNKR